MRSREKSVDPSVVELATPRDVPGPHRHPFFRQHHERLLTVPLAKNVDGHVDGLRPGPRLQENLESARQTHPVLPLGQPHRRQGPTRPAELLKSLIGDLRKARVRHLFTVFVEPAPPRKHLHGSPSAELGHQDRPGRLAPDAQVPEVRRRVQQCGDGLARS